MEKIKTKKREKLDRQVMVRLTESQFKKISKESFDRDLGVSHIIREAIKFGRPDLFSNSPQP
jgi:hypothetical protein